MGKTPKPLTILVDSQWVNHPAVLALVAQGHTVAPLLEKADLILSPTAHYWREEMFETTYLIAAMKAARKVVGGST